jgi:recombination protein RecT
MSKELAIRFENQLNQYYLETINDLLQEQEINPQQFLHMAVNQIKRNPRLIQVFKTNPASVFSSILTCAEFGLSPTSQMGEAWLIPYGKECQFQIGYQGLAKILYKNPDVQNITAESVYENDEFHYSLGLSPNLTHTPATSNRGNLVAVYCVVRFREQEPIFKVMSVEELQEIQKLSKAGNRSIWFSKTDPQNWMLKKTCFKQLCKMLPKHLNMGKVIAYDNIVEGGGVMRVDSDNKPIVVEEVKETRASKFQQAMQEDKKEEEVVEIPGFEGTLDELDDALNIKPAENKKEEKQEGFDNTTIDDVDDIDEEKIEKVLAEPIEALSKTDEEFAKDVEIDNIKQAKKELGDDSEPDVDRAGFESERELQTEKHFMSNDEELDFEQEEAQRRAKITSTQNDFLNSDISEDVDVEM